MNKTCVELKEAIIKAHQTETSVSEAEQLSAKCLAASMALADDIRAVDLKARMRKIGLRNIRSQAYLDELAKHEKKPTEAYIDAAINLNVDIAPLEMELADKEVELNNLKHYYEVFKEAHQYFRAIMKAGFGGG